MSLPEKLLSLRKQNGFTQMELAEKLHVSRQAISRWEVGTAAPSTENLKELSALYDVSVDYLLGVHAEAIVVASETRDLLGEQAQLRSNNQLHLVILALSLVLAIVIVVCSTLVNLKKEEENPIIPMSEMDCLEADDGYPTIIFSID